MLGCRETVAAGKGKYTRARARVNKNARVGARKRWGMGNGDFQERGAGKVLTWKGGGWIMEGRERRIPMMGRFERVFLAVAGAWVGCAGGAAGQWGGFEIDYEGVSAAGKGLFEAFAPEEVKQEYEFADAETLRGYGKQVQGLMGAFAGESLAGLAAWAGPARQLASALGGTAEGEWLANHLDFIEVAGEMTRQGVAGTTGTTGTTGTAGKTGTAGGRPGTAVPQAGKTTTPPAGGGKTTASPAPAVRASGAEETERAVEAFMRKLPGAAPAKSAGLAPQCKKIFREAGLPEELVWQAEVESSWNPLAKSPAGAAGLYQFMKPSAVENGLKVEPKDERLDALLCAAAAARYLKKLHGRFGDWPLALAAYNTGPGRVGKLLKETGGRTFGDIQPRLSAETKLYVPKIDALVRLREGKKLAELPGAR